MVASLESKIDDRLQTSQAESAHMSSVRMRFFQCHAPSVSVTGSEMIFTDEIFTAGCQVNTG